MLSDLKVRFICNSMSPSLAILMNNWILHFGVSREEGILKHGEILCMTREATVNEFKKQLGITSTVSEKNT